MRLHLTLIAFIALLVVGAALGTAQIKMLNSATGGPASATTVGTLHSIDSKVFMIGSASCMRSSLTSISYLPTKAALDPTTAGGGGTKARAGFTIQWWYKVQQPTTFGYLWGELSWGSFRCFQNGVAGVGNVILRGPITDLITNGAPLQNSVDKNGWVHFAVVYDHALLRAAWFVNGAPNKSLKVVITGKGADFKCFGYDGSSGVPTHEDDFRIYNWARTPADIAADYNKRAIGTSPSGTPNVPDLGYYEADLPIRLVISGTPSLGGTVNLNLTASASGGKTYQVASSLGTGPISIGTRSLGLSLDGLFQLSVSGLAPQVFQGYAGVLNTTGNGTANIKIPNIAAIVGTRIYSAFVTVDLAAPLGVKEISPTEFFTVVK